jgi:hypothetical protein
MRWGRVGKLFEKHFRSYTNSLHSPLVLEAERTRSADIDLIPVIRWLNWSFSLAWKLFLLVVGVITSWSAFETNTLGVMDEVDLPSDAEDAEADSLFLKRPTRSRLFLIRLLRLVKSAEKIYCYTRLIGFNTI